MRRTDAVCVAWATWARSLPLKGQQHHTARRPAPSSVFPASWALGPAAHAAAAAVAAKLAKAPAPREAGQLSLSSAASPHPVRDAVR